MGRFIAEFGGKYCEWSTVVDAPITYLLTEEEMRGHLHEQYGDDGLASFESRMERVRKQGCSGMNYTRADLLSFNRAGPHESHLATEEEFLLHYSVTQGQADPEIAPDIPTSADGLSKPLLAALETSDGQVQKALHVLLARCKSRTLELLLHGVCVQATEDLVPGESALAYFGGQLNALEAGGLAPHEVLLVKLLCEAGTEDLRFIFSNEIYPLFAASKSLNIQSGYRTKMPEFSGNAPSMHWPAGRQSWHTALSAMCTE